MVDVVSHIAQFRQMTVRVVLDADRRYVEDPRWKDVTEEETQLAVQIINKVIGEEYPVLGITWKGAQPFYNILVRPTFYVFDHLGRPERVSYAFIPCDYAEIVQRGFWEAR